jgi:ubiquitin C-terminal hydrolase
MSWFINLFQSHTRPSINTQIGHPVSQPVSQPASQPVSQPASHPGIRNETGSDCFLISVLQTAARVPSFRHILLQTCELVAQYGETQEKKKSAMIISQHFLQLIEDQSTGRSSTQLSSKTVRECFKALGLCNASSGHEDASEVLVRLFTLHDEISKHHPSIREISPPCQLKEIKRYEPTDYLEPVHNTQVHRADQRIVLTTLNPRHNSSLSYLDEMNARTFVEHTRLLALELPSSFVDKLAQFRDESLPSIARKEKEKLLCIEFLSHFFYESTTHDEPALYFDKKAHQMRRYNPSEKIRCFNSPPEELTTSIRRFDPMGNKLSHRERSSSAHHDREVRVPLQQSFTLDESIAHQRTTYELDSFIVHMGTTAAGHYISYQKIDDQWYCFNDSSVTRADDIEVKDALERSYLQHYKKAVVVDPHAIMISQIRGESLQVVPKQTLPSQSPTSYRVPLWDQQQEPLINRSKNIASIDELLSWKEAYMGGNAKIENIPMRYMHTLHEMIWLRDQMPNEHMYGEQVMNRFAGTIHTSCPPLLYPHGDNLFEQLIEKETAHHRTLTLAKELDLLQALSNSFQHMDKRELHRCFNLLDPSTQREILLQIATEHGLSFAKQQIEGRHHFGEEETKKDIHVLKKVVAQESNIAALFPGKPLLSLVTVKQGQESLIPFKEALFNSSISSGELSSLFDRLGQDLKNECYGLVYHAHITAVALDYAERALKDNIGIITVKNADGSSILEKTIKKTSDLLKGREKEGAELKALHQTLIEVDERLSTEQKKEILKRI